MLLDSKSRIVDNINISKGKFFILNGADPEYFEPVANNSIENQLPGFALGADSSSKVDVTSMFAAPINVSKVNNFSGQKNTWVRVVSKNGVEVADFSNSDSWAVLTSEEDYKIGLVDLIKSIDNGTYNSENSNWRKEKLNNIQTGEALLNGNLNKVSYKFNTLKNFPQKSFEQIRKPDIVAQEEFSQYVNGLRMPPVFKNNNSQLVNLKNERFGDFKTNRVTSKSVRNRLILNDNEFFEVELDTSEDYPANSIFKSKWFPVEKRRFPFNVGDDEYIIEVATPLTVIQYDANLFYIGKLIPAAMEGKPNETSIMFLRIFTMIFEDGT